jgi:hypothetical protein
VAPAAAASSTVHSTAGSGSCPGLSTCASMQGHTGAMGLLSSPVRLILPGYHCLQGLRVTLHNEFSNQSRPQSRSSIAKPPCDPDPGPGTGCSADYLWHSKARYQGLPESALTRAKAPPMADTADAAAAAGSLLMKTPSSTVKLNMSRRGACSSGHLQRWGAERGAARLASLTNVQVVAHVWALHVT